MSDLEVHPEQPAAEAEQGLNQWQRLGNIFSSPSKTFNDIKRGNLSWWMPFLVSVIVTIIFFSAVSSKVGWKQAAENEVRANPSQAAQMAEMPAGQRATAMRIPTIMVEVGVGASPVIGILAALLVALVLWGTINFGFGGKATYQQVFTVFFYATLPLAIKPILSSLALFAGLAPEGFLLRNYAGTNIAYYLPYQDTNKALYALLSQFDIVTIWTAILLSMGLAIVAGKKRSAGYASVIGWWAILAAVQVISGMLTG